MTHLSSFVFFEGNGLFSICHRDKKLTSDILKEILLKHGRMLPSTDEELVTELKAYLKNLPGM